MLRYQSSACSQSPSCKALGLYKLDAALADSKIILGDTAVIKLTRVEASLASNAAGAAGATGFADLDWKATFNAVVALQLLGADDGDALAGSMDLTAALDFTIVDGTPVFGSLIVGGAFSYKGDVFLDGTVTLAVPCEAGGNMFDGRVAVGFKGSAMTVIGGYADVKYGCNGNGGGAGGRLSLVGGAQVEPDRQCPTRHQPQL